MSHARVSFDVSVPVQVRPDDVGYISHCPVLDVYSQGPTQEEAIRNIVEAVQLFIESCFSRGCLDQVLKDCGFVWQGPLESPPEPIEDANIISVPLALVADAENKKHRQANAR